MFEEGVAQLDAPAPPKFSDENASSPPLMTLAEWVGGEDIDDELPKSDIISFAFLRLVVALFVLGALFAWKSRSNKPFPLLWGGTGAAATFTCVADEGCCARICPLSAACEGMEDVLADDCEGYAREGLALLADCEESPNAPPSRSIADGLLAVVGLAWTAGASALGLVTGGAGAAEPGTAKVSGSGIGPSIAQRLLSYFERMNCSILLLMGRRKSLFSLDSLKGGADLGSSQVVTTYCSGGE